VNDSEHAERRKVKAAIAKKEWMGKCIVFSDGSY
jgi:hypothetical protein